MTMPPKAYRYAIPTEYYENDSIRRYGFHGTSHRYVTKRAIELMGRKGHQAGELPSGQRFLLVRGEGR